jgi:hypothetical protein
MAFSMKANPLCFGLALLFLTGLGSQAGARPRDDVMSAAFRCGTIAVSRQWLDCIYGSAQPVRATLGLAPVPQMQSQLVASPPEGGQIMDQATRDLVLSGAVHCDGLNSDRQWLDCYYAATNAMRAKLGLASHAQTHSVSDIDMKPGEAPQYASAGANGGVQDSFGFAARPRHSLSQVVSQLVSYKFDQYGIFTVKLANGQVWRQMSGDTTYAHWNLPPAKYTAFITMGASDSYNLRLKGNPGLFKVKREA